MALSDCLPSRLMGTWVLISVRRLHPPRSTTRHNFFMTNFLISCFFHTWQKWFLSLLSGYSAQYNHTCTYEAIELGMQLFLYKFKQYLSFLCKYKYKDEIMLLIRNYTYLIKINKIFRCCVQCVFIILKKRGNVV